MLPRETDAVPTNTMVWLFGYESSFLAGEAVCGGAYPALRGADGDVELTLMELETTAAIGGVLVLDPMEDLTVGDEYSVYGCLETGSEQLVGTFVVTDAADTQAPPVPVLQLDEGRYSNGICGGVAFAEFTVTGQGAVVALDVNSVASVETGLIENAAAVFASDDSELFVVGRGGCSPMTYDPQFDETVTARVGTFDLAGNFSGWSDPESTSFTDGCGCSSSGTGTLTPLWVVPLLLFLRKQRVADRQRTTARQTRRTD